MTRKIEVNEIPKLIINNFGPIKHAEITLKPLTIIIGANGTGKSYICRSLYSISNVTSQITRKSLELGRYDVENLKKTPFKSRVKKYSNLLTEFPFNIPDEMFPEFCEDLATDYLKLEERKYSDVQRLLIREAERVFGSDSQSLIRLATKNSRIQYEHVKYSLYFNIDSTNEKDFGFSLKQEYIEEITSKTKEIVKQYSDSFVMSFHRREAEKLSLETSWLYLFLTFSTLLDQLTGEEESFNTYVLPAERAGLLLGYSTIASAMMSAAPTFLLRGANIPSLTGVLGDFISLILSFREQATTKKRSSSDDYELSNRRKPDSDQLSIAKRIETDILLGKIVFERENGRIPTHEIKFQQGRATYPLHLASSMISELAPLVLYLKYLSFNESDYLVFEEPEAHLHPSAQTNIAKIIINLVRCGINVILTTHSDFLVTQISNLVVPSLSKKKKGRKRKSREIRDEITPDEIEAVLMKADKEKEGCISERLDVTTDGISQESFTAVAAKLYEESMEKE